MTARLWIASAKAGTGTDSSSASSKMILTVFFMAFSFRCHNDEHTGGMFPRVLCYVNITIPKKKEESVNLLRPFSPAHETELFLDE